jgi:uncharacterized protein YbbC (DUF1343 family)
MRVLPGIEVLLRSPLPELRGARIGAVVHPASVLPDLRHTADALLAEKSWRLVALFGPQHGARGEQQDNMIESPHYCDPETGLPVHSLYSETRRPTEEMLDAIDVLVFDLQDIGARVYTFIHTMAYCMEACARFAKRLVVLDRPNPIGGVQVEGNLLDMEFRSFVGLYPIPMRHGMTVGELARLFNQDFGLRCDLTVVEMDGWRRAYWFNDTGLPWVAPSPNIPTLDSATVYPGTVLVEGTSLSEGRGTTRPFELIGAPFMDAARYASRMNALNLAGVHFRPAYFQPCFQKWSGLVCGGVQIHVFDRELFEPYLTGVMLIAEARALYPDSFDWRRPPYEYEFEKLPIAILCGGDRIPRLIEASADPAVIRQSWADDVAQFHIRRRSCLIYD